MTTENMDFTRNDLRTVCVPLGDDGRRSIKIFAYIGGLEVLVVSGEGHETPIGEALRTRRSEAPRPCQRPRVAPPAALTARELRDLGADARIAFRATWALALGRVGPRETQRAVKLLESIQKTLSRSPAFAEPATAIGELIEMIKSRSGLPAPEAIDSIGAGICSEIDTIIAAAA